MQHEAVALSSPVTSPGEAVPTLELRSLVKRYGQVEAVKGVDLAVPAGEFLTVLGPSGSGKTTILRLVAGFTEPSDGQIFLSGKDVSRMAPAQRGIGMVFQHYALFPHMTAAANVAYGLKMRGWGKAARAERVREVLELVGLHGHGDRLPRQLSGGQQQRVALARALAFGPSLLLMDEPLGALDRELRIKMAGELRRIHSELQTTFVYVTHDREEALTLSDRIAIMQNGLVDSIATPSELFTRPPSAFAASFFGGHNVLPTRVHSVGLDTAIVDVMGRPVEVTASADLSGRSEGQLVIPASAISAEEHDGYIPFRATVGDVLYMGESIRLTCALEDESATVTAAVDVRSASAVSSGAVVTLYVDRRRVVVVP